MEDVTEKPFRGQEEDLRLLGWLAEGAPDVTTQETTTNGSPKMEEALRASTEVLRARDELFRKMLEIETVGIIFFDPAGDILAANDAFLRMGGYTQEDIVAGRLRWDRLTPPEWMPASRQAIAQLQTLGSTTPYEKEYYRKDGSRFWGLFAAKGLSQHEGVEFILDITERKQTEEALRASTEELQRAYEREKNIAEILQRPLTLPVAQDTFPGLMLATRYEAALSEAQVGGDFFDAFALPHGRVALVVADASGKGLQAAARAIQVKEVLRAFTREYPHSPTHILSRINDYVCDTKHFDEEPWEGFVTLTLVVLDPHTGEASVVNAGAEPPLLLRRGGQCESVDSSGLPLGVERGELYLATPLRLSPGDTLLLATDGITEARNDGEFLGFEGLERLARGAASVTCVQAMAEQIVEGARAFAQKGFCDDVCLLLARRQGPL